MTATVHTFSRYTVSPMPILQKALVVDQSGFERRRAMRACRTAGFPFDFYEAADLGQMDKVLSEHDFALVILDDRLGLNTGAEALQMLASRPRQADAAVILTGEYFDPAFLQLANRFGVRDCILKDDLNPRRLGETLALLGCKPQSLKLRLAQMPA